MAEGEVNSPVPAFVCGRSHQSVTAALSVVYILLSSAPFRASVPPAFNESLFTPEGSSTQDYSKTLGFTRDGDPRTLWHDQEVIKGGGACRLSSQVHTRIVTG